MCWRVAGLSWGGWWVRVKVRVSGGVVGGFLAVGQVWCLPHRCGDSAIPVAAPRQDRLGCTIGFGLTGPLFPIGIEHLIYMKFFCYGSSYGY